MWYKFSECGSNDSTGNASVSPEGMCSMFRTVGKVISSLGFSQEASEVNTQVALSSSGFHSSDSMGDWLSMGDW